MNVKEMAEIIGKECTLFGKEPCVANCGLFDPFIPKPIKNKECIIQTKDGRRLKIIKNVDQIRSPTGRLMGGIESFENITEMKETHEKLSQTLVDVEKMNKVMTGREERILELKREINEMREKLGITERYKIE